MFPIQKLTKLPWAGRGMGSHLIPNHCPGNWQPFKPISSPCMFLWQVSQSLQFHVVVTQRLVPTTPLGPFDWTPHSQIVSNVNFIHYLYGRENLQSPETQDKQSPSHTHKLRCHYQMIPCPRKHFVFHKVFFTKCLFWESTIVFHGIL